MSPSRPPHAPGRPRGPSFATLTRVELRKSVDTRAGQALLALAPCCSPSRSSVTWSLHGAADGAELRRLAARRELPRDRALLPVVGVLAMASEWTQRTALTTFTLTPRRLRVLAAKFAAAVVLGLLATVVVDAMAAAGLAVRGTGPRRRRRLGRPRRRSSAARRSRPRWRWSWVPRSARSSCRRPPRSSPTSWRRTSCCSPSPRRAQGKAPWVDVNEAFGWLSRFDVSGHVGQLVTPLVLWIAVPFAFGAVAQRAPQRELTDAAGRPLHPRERAPCTSGPLPGPREPDRGASASRGSAVPRLRRPGVGAGSRRRRGWPPTRA